MIVNLDKADRIGIKRFRQIDVELKGLYNRHSCANYHTYNHEPSYLHIAQIDDQFSMIFAHLARSTQREAKIGKTGQKSTHTVQILAKHYLGVLDYN